MDRIFAGKREFPFLGPQFNTPASEECSGLKWRSDVVQAADPSVCGVSINAASQKAPLKSSVGDWVKSVLVDQGFGIGEFASGKIGLPTEKAVKHRQPDLGT